MCRVRADVSEERIASIIGLRWLLVTANVPTSLIHVTLMMEAIHSSETSSLTKVTRRNVTEDRILQGLVCPLLPCLSVV
jgi:hypothetical protein